jgi:hypothetical protein
MSCQHTIWLGLRRTAGTAVRASECGRRLFQQNPRKFAAPVARSRAKKRMFFQKRPRLFRPVLGRQLLTESAPSWRMQTPCSGSIFGCSPRCYSPRPGFLLLRGNQHHDCACNFCDGVLRGAAAAAGNERVTVYEVGSSAFYAALRSLSGCRESAPSASSIARSVATNASGSGCLIISEYIARS